jgi:hypothetical protein
VEVTVYVRYQDFKLGLESGFNIFYSLLASYITIIPSCSPDPNPYPNPDPYHPDKKEVKIYKEKAKTRLELTMPLLNRGDDYASTLNESDYITVLRADVPYANHIESETMMDEAGTQPIPSEANEGVTFGSINSNNNNNTNDSNGLDDVAVNGIKNPRKRKLAKGTEKMPNPLPFPHSNSNPNPNPEYEAPSDSPHKLIDMCNACGNSISFTDNSQGLAKACSICSSSYHYNCCEIGESSGVSESSGSSNNPNINANPSTSSSRWICRVCLIISMISNTAEEEESPDNPVPNLNSKSLAPIDSTTKKIRKTDHNDNKASSNQIEKNSKKRKKIDDSCKSSSQVEKNPPRNKKKDSDKSSKITKSKTVKGVIMGMNALSQREPDSEEAHHIHPDILASLEACESVLT